MAYLFLGLAILAAVILLLRWAVNADPALLADILKITAILAAVAGVLLVIWRGPYGLLLIPVGAGPFLWRRHLRRKQAQTEGRPSGQTSSLRTAMLDMALDHASGRLDGTVRAGPYQGSRLAAMSLAQLRELLAACRADDPESVPVLEAFLDRNFGAGWRAQAGAGPGSAGSDSPRPGTMSRAEAYEVLGVEPGASDEEIRAAHHRLMLKVHPDHGGSTYLAARLNEARDTLLGA